MGAPQRVENHTVLTLEITDREHLRNGVEWGHSMTAYRMTKCMSKIDPNVSLLPEYRAEEVEERWHRHLIERITGNHDGDTDRIRPSHIHSARLEVSDRRHTPKLVVHASGECPVAHVEAAPPRCMRARGETIEDGLGIGLRGKRDDLGGIRRRREHERAGITDGHDAAEVAAVNRECTDETGALIGGEGHRWRDA